MGKQPAFQFYPNDWARDLEEHPLEIEGAWIRICCKLWWAEPKGKLTRTLSQWAKILRVDEAIAGNAINYILEQKIGDVSHNGNGDITVLSRRMYNDHKDRELNMLRQRRFKEKQRGNASVTDEKRESNGAYSSSSSSSTSKRKNILSDEEWISKIKELHPWINWEDLNREMDTWLLNNPHRKKTRRFITGWILRKQSNKPMPAGKEKSW